MTKSCAVILFAILMIGGMAYAYDDDDLRRDVYEHVVTPCLKVLYEGTKKGFTEFPSFNEYIRSEEMRPYIQEVTEGYVEDFKAVNTMLQLADGKPLDHKFAFDYMREGCLKEARSYF